MQTRPKLVLYPIPVFRYTMIYAKSFIRPGPAVGISAVTDLRGKSLPSA
jgi:hypothetical protein